MHEWQKKIIGPTSQSMQCEGKFIKELSTFYSELFARIASIELVLLCHIRYSNWRLSVRTGKYYPQLFSFLLYTFACPRQIVATNGSR